jgi:hypothetical protein
MGIRGTVHGYTCSWLINCSVGMYTLDLYSALPHLPVAFRCPAALGGFPGDPLSGNQPCICPSRTSAAVVDDNPLLVERMSVSLRVQDRTMMKPPEIDLRAGNEIWRKNGLQLQVKIVLVDPVDPVLTQPHPLKLSL